MINQRCGILKTLIQLYILSRFLLVKDDDSDQRDDEDGDSYDDYGKVNNPFQPLWGEPTSNDSDSTGDDKAGLANKEAEWEADRYSDDDDKTPRNDGGDNTAFTPDPETNIDYSSNSTGHDSIAGN